MPKPKQREPQIDLNPEFRRALDVMENTHKSVFVTGRAGTGKSTLLSYFRGITGKRVAVLAPTGVAALNVKGQTVHSFFHFKPNITPEQVKKARSSGGGQNIYRNLDTIVIDEISMVRADLLDCVDKFLRLNGLRIDVPFGGIQMVFIGDLYQLPPVVASGERSVFNSFYDTPYFYSANVFKSFDMEFVELMQVYRQHDEKFIGLLNSIRNNSIGEDGLALLNQRCNPQFQPPPGDFYIYLTTTNALAEEVNSRELAKLKTRLHTFASSIQGDFGNQYLPTAVELRVKPGAQIMMLNNDADGRWVNGSIGEIVSIDPAPGGDYIITADLGHGDIVEVTPYTWEIFRFYVEDRQLQSQVVGTFTQYPLMLAWAVTIHKSQGKTFDRVIIDIGQGTFVYGQTYVALSRCTTLEGIVLVKPLQKKHVWTDFKVVDFLTRYQYKKAAQSLPVDDKVEMIRQAIKNGTELRILYLKPRDEKSERVIVPESVGEMEYQGKTYVGVRAFCKTRNEERTFRVDRILEIAEA
ncbi:MAG: AAA family ATPase [Chloroflexota bacterium]